MVTFLSYVSNACHSLSGVAERLQHTYIRYARTVYEMHNNGVASSAHVKWCPRYTILQLQKALEIWLCRRTCRQARHAKRQLAAHVRGRSTKAFGSCVTSHVRYTRNLCEYMRLKSWLAAFLRPSIAAQP